MNKTTTKTKLLWCVLLLSLFSTGEFAHAQVTAEIREDTIVLFASESVQAAGLDLQSDAGRLVPVPDPPGAAPFLFFLSNTPNQITSGDLGRTVTIDGAFNTFAGYNGDPAGDLRVSWGDGPTPVNVPVSLSSEPIPLEVLTPLDRPVGGRGGGGLQNPSAVPEPGSLMVWLTLGLATVFQRWRVCVQ